MGRGRPEKRPADRVYAEKRGTDPEGNIFDIAEGGFDRDIATRRSAPRRRCRSEAQADARSRHRRRGGPRLWRCRPTRSRSATCSRASSCASCSAPRPGQDYDVWARLIARHLPRHIPARRPSSCRTCRAPATCSRPTGSTTWRRATAPSGAWSAATSRTRRCRTSPACATTRSSSTGSAARSSPTAAASRWSGRG